MHTFRPQDRDQAMDHTISFHEVPMFRGLAFAINHIEHHGAPVAIFSADRRDAVIAEHNKQFGTHLKGQAELVRLHAQDPVHFAAANSPTTTSHCLYADAIIAALLTRHGHPTHAGDRLPWFALGLDLTDRYKVEHPDHFLAVARELHYEFVQPYPQSPSEHHHVICVKSPIGALEQSNQISRNRSSN